MMDVQVVKAILQVKSIHIHLVLHFLPIINFLITLLISKLQTLSIDSSADALPVKS